MNGRTPAPIVERLARFVDFDGDCWEWMGWRHKHGYGGIGIGSKADGTNRNVYAHRLAYEVLVESIPEGFDIDHLCMNRGCINPDHLEAVTHQENTRRAARSHETCQRGHPWVDETTYVNPTNGRRQCVTCRDLAKIRRTKETS